MTHDIFLKKKTSDHWFLIQMLSSRHWSKTDALA